MSDDVDTLNRALVGVRGDRIVIANRAAVADMSRAEALVLAAWLVVLADNHDGVESIVSDDVDTLNRALVGVRGDRIVIANRAAVADMSRAEALVLATWLVVLADNHDGVESNQAFPGFMKAIDAVMKT